MSKLTGLQDPKVDKLVGRRIAARRLALGLSTSVLAQALQVSQRQIKSYERGENAVPVVHLVTLAALLEVPASQLAGEGPEGIEDSRLGWQLGRKGAVELLRIYVDLAPKSRVLFRSWLDLGKNPNRRASLTDALARHIKSESAKI